jgi:chromosome segregation ATPase
LTVFRAGGYIAPTLSLISAQKKANSSMSSSEATRGLDDLALAVYLERLFRGRRVLWLGDASTGAPDRVARAAASVLAADPRAIADRVERENLSIVRLSHGSPLPAGPYDVVVVPDLAGTGLATPDRIRQLASALARDGVLVVASSNSEAAVRLGRAPEVAAPPYDALYELLAQRFAGVRMLGQAPFVGYTVADFSAAGEPSVVFDGSLLGDASETPERFIALCGDSEVVLDAYAVVQIPARAGLAGPVVARPQASFESDTERQLGVLRDEVRAARERSEHLVRELDEQRVALRRSRVASEQPPAATPAAVHVDPRVGELESQLRASREQIDAGNVHAEGLEATLSERTSALAELDGEVERLRMELRSVRDESETRVAALRIAREELDKLRATPPAAPPEDYGRLEVSLRERGQEILELRAELARRATVVRDLVEELRSLRDGQLIDETSATVDAERRLAEAAARLTLVEGQLHALRADREAAVQRALRADAERTEAGFRADEALGKLAEAAEAQARTDEERARREAELSGFVRGLRARAAELEELRAQAEARLSLVRLDLETAKHGNLTLERALADLREQLELELVRASSAPTVDTAAIARANAELDLLRGERAGLSARLEDREIALEAVRAAATTAATAAAAAAAASAATIAETTAAAATAVAAAQRNDLAAQLAAAGRADILEADVRRLSGALADARASLAALGASIDLTSSAAARQTLADAIEEPGDLPDAAARAADEELRRLHDALGGREAELLLVQGKLRTSERETRSVRDAVDQARAGLEEILARATTSGDASSADRIGALLRLLTRA